MIWSKWSSIHATKSVYPVFLLISLKGNLVSLMILSLNSRNLWAPHTTHCGSSSRHKIHYDPESSDNPFSAYPQFLENLPRGRFPGNRKAISDVSWHMAYHMCSLSERRLQAPTANQISITMRCNLPNVIEHLLTFRD